MRFLTRRWEYLVLCFDLLQWCLYDKSYIQHAQSSIPYIWNDCLKKCLLTENEKKVKNEEWKKKIMFMREDLIGDTCCWKGKCVSNIFLVIYMRIMRVLSLLLPKIYFIRWNHRHFMLLESRDSKSTPKVKTEIYHGPLWCWIEISLQICTWIWLHTRI